MTLPGRPPATVRYGLMKAMAQRTWKAGERLELVELPTPEPRRGEVRVGVQAVGVNPVDWKMRSHGPLRQAARLLGPKPPVVVGVDFAGVVDAVGPGVVGFSPGDRVVGGTDFSRGQRGSYADTVVVREDQLCPVPDSVDIAVAAALPVSGVTARMAVVDLGRIRRESTADRRVLVLGASGAVGQLAVQIAKSEDAFVVGVCSAKNADLVGGWAPTRSSTTAGATRWSRPGPMLPSISSSTASAATPAPAAGPSCRREGATSWWRATTPQPSCRCSWRRRAPGASWAGPPAGGWHRWWLRWPTAGSGWRSRGPCRSPPPRRPTCSAEVGV